MSFLFPDANRIANIGHVNAVSILSTDQLRDYVIYVRMAKDAFFSDAFTYQYDGVKLTCAQDQGKQFVNVKAVCDAISDPRHVNVHHGSQHVFFKHAFKIGETVTIGAGASMHLEGQASPRTGSINIQVYGVFLNATDGSPMPTWAISPEDGSVELLYEHYSTGSGFANLQASANDSAISEALGIPGFKSGSLISGGGTLVVNGLRTSCNSNIACLTPNGPSILGANEPVIHDCIWNDRPTPTTVRLVRAMDKNVQTLLFATVSDTGSAGVTDVYAIMRCVPGIASVNNYVPALTCAAGYTAGDSSIVFEDTSMTYSSPAHPVYIRKLMTMTPGGQNDPWRARRLRFPPIDVAFTTSSTEASMIDGKRKISAAHIHKTMPNGGLGTRLLQLASVACHGEYESEWSNTFDLTRSTLAAHDISTSLAMQVDLSLEPAQTHDCICESVNAFFDDAGKRQAFLTEFNSKFPGVLTTSSLGSASAMGISVNRALVSAVNARTTVDVSLCVFLTIDFCFPECNSSGLLDANRLKTNRLTSVPVIFCLA